ncbi:MAG: lipoprotein signal peptidase [Deltaproteobacteria bacterium]|nr:lipoprotein signal peptidase [Deltaproteobacteria bacterium]
MTAVSFVVVVLDQLSKWLVLQNIARGEIIPVVPSFFNLTLTFNRGAAFGILAGVPDGTRQLLLGVTTLIALSAVLYFLRKDYRDQKLAQFSLALIFGGAVGNIIDRFRLGEVVDFLDVYWQNYHWPAFNVADSAICVGVCILILRGNKSHESAEKKAVEL